MGFKKAYHLLQAPKKCWFGFRVSYFRSPNRSVDPTETPQLPGHNAQALLGLSTSAAGFGWFVG